MLSRLVLWPLGVGLLRSNVLHSRMMWPPLFSSSFHSCSPSRECSPVALPPTLDRAARSIESMLLLQSKSSIKSSDAIESHGDSVSSDSALAIRPLLRADLRDRAGDS
uniref:Putative secreted protein n=1 Tax=Anopheles marajoara TaxID=58244 RepID=A0A2M4C8N7_9DIPT